jgi:iron(III) transport system substrate-binding protein
MLHRRLCRPAVFGPVAVLTFAFSLACNAQELNLYSARHYQTDEALYADFTRQTGVKINRVDADDAGILARLRAEGSASPADVILLVDAARLWRAEIDGLFQPVRSPLLEARIPSHLRGKTSGDGTPWFGLSTRARVVVYDKRTVPGTDVDTYEKLAEPVNKGKLCTRSGSHPYNLSLFGAMLEHIGAPATETWLRGLVLNMARPPKGGDTDQIKAVANGECQIAITNSYYLARLMRSEKSEDKKLMTHIGISFPNQKTWGSHVNIAGAGVAKFAPHREAAVKFVEYLASDKAQAYFADGNNEWPAVTGVKLNNPALQKFGQFKSETIPTSVVGMNQVKIQQMLDRVGYK